MMKKETALIWIFLLLMPLWAVAQSASSALEIVRQSDRKTRGKSSKSSMTAQIIRPKYTRTMSMTGWSLGTEYSMILITGPKKDEGTVFLKRGNELWNWIPSIERIIKLPPSMMSQNWMGTDFTNDDLVKQSSIVVDYNHKIIGEEVMGGYPCWKIEMIPKPESAVVWGKVLIWISKDSYMQMRVEFYDEDGSLVNTMIGSEPKTFDGVLLPSRLEMIPADKPGNKTVLITKTLKFNIAIDESFFTTRNMRAIKVTD